MMVMMGMALGEAISVTTFGPGGVKRCAVDTVHQRATEDALEPTFLDPLDRIVKVAAQTAIRRLWVVRQVTIRETTHTSETLVSAAEVIEVRHSVTRIAARHLVNKSESSGVMPLDSLIQGGIILDSDW